MAHLSLYRKHRPRTFVEVVGQEHVTRTLVNAISEDSLHHAYLFTGQRGTGKTSTARILAAAVNCEKGPTAEPCGTCDQCTSIIAGNNVDVVELDMASHGGVDDARDLRDRAVFAPAAGRRKVYILDEVHMASTAAFNALLKVIEEPPPHVLFTMATTDPQKVLPTIMSRVQRLDLRRVPAAVLTEHLRRLGGVEGFRLDDAAAAAVVAAGDGSVRDTLSVLEQVLAFAADDGARVDGVLPVSGEQVTRVLGATPFELVHGVAEAIADADVAAGLTRVQELLDAGHDLRRFTLDLARHLRDLLVTAAAPDVADLVDATEERRAALAQQAERFGTDTLVRAVELVGEVLVEQRQGPPRLPLELAVARLATPGADGDLAALADRVARLETAVAGGAGGVAAPRARAAGSATTADRPATTVVADTDPSRVGAAPAPGSSSAPPASGSGSAATRPDRDAARDVATDDPEGPVTRRGAGDVDTAAGGGPDATTDATDAVEATDTAEAADTADTADTGDTGDTADTADTADVTDTAGTSDAADTADTVDATDTGATSDVAEAGSRAGAGTRDGAAGGGLAGRARALADGADDRPPPTPLERRPGTTTVERDQVPPAPGGDDLASIVDRWEAILDVVADDSRRAKAFYEPATPIRLHNGVLLLSYPTTRRFHAEQGKGGEVTADLAAAVHRVTGLERVRVDVRLEDGGPRRPAPAPVADPVHDEPPADEQAAVAEAEEEPPAVPADPDEVDRLLRDQLGAQPLPDED